MVIHVEDKLKPGLVNGRLADAIDVETTGNSTVQADLNTNTASISSINTMLTQLGGVGINWSFDSAISSDPALNTFRFNNADPTQATILYLDAVSLSGRFDEFLTQFASGGFIFLQDRTNTGNSYLFRTTAAITLESGTDSWYEVDVQFLQSKGTLTAVDGDTFSFIFIPITGTGGGGGGVQLPNMFLNEIQETNTNTFTNRVDVTADAQFVRFWLRSALVTPSNVSTSGEGLVINEANGTLADNGPTFQQGSDANNVYIYFTIPDAFDTATDLSTVYVVIKDGDEIVDSINVDDHFVLQSDIAGSVAGQPYRSNTGLNGGSFLHYKANQTIELFFVTVEQFFDIPEVNAKNVDLTRGVKDLPESSLESEAQAKLNYTHGVPDDDQFKLDQLVEVSTTSASATITGTDTIYYKLGAFTNDSSDYFTTDFDTGLPPSLGQTTTWTVLVPHNHDITSVAGLESGAGTVTLIQHDIVLTGATGVFNLYRAVLPSTASATNFFVFVGTTNTITEINPSSLVKIDRTNVEANFLTHIENPNGTTDESVRLLAVENKVSVLYPLAPDVDALTEWGDIYEPERAQQEVVLTTGYDLVADYRGPTTGTERYESTGVTYSDAGTNVVTYTGLSESLQRGFGFKVNAPANQTLMWLVDGSDRIPFIDMTAAGNYRVNNYTQATTASTPTTETTFIAPGAGTDGVIATGGGNNAIFIIPDYPTGATVTSRSASVEFDVLLNGVDSLAGHFETFDIPETPTAQDRIQRTFSIYLGPQYGNRSVNVTIDYRFTVPSPSEFRMIFTLQVAPSDVTIRVQDVAITRTYTPASTTTRTDNFVILQDGSGDYTFTGENELLMVFHPISQTNIMEVVPVAVDSTGSIDELNDRNVPVPVHGFDDVEIPDTTALANFEFRTFRADHYLIHRDLSSLLGDRALQWVYGLARLRTVATIHAVNEAIDLASGSTLNGVALATASGPLVPNIVYQATGTGTATGELVASVVLPSDYTNYDFVHIAEFDNLTTEWRHTDISTVLLNSGLVDSNHSVRLQGDTDMTWTSGTRTLALVGGSQEIALVILFDN